VSNWNENTDDVAKRRWVKSSISSLAKKINYYSIPAMFLIFLLNFTISPNNLSLSPPFLNCPGENIAFCNCNFIGLNDEIKLYNIYSAYTVRSRGRK